MALLPRRSRPRTPTARVSATSMLLPRQRNFEAAFLICLLLLAIAYVGRSWHRHRYDTFFHGIVNIGKLLSEDLVQDGLGDEEGGLWEGGDRLFGRIESENAVV